MANSHITVGRALTMNRSLLWAIVLLVYSVLAPAGVAQDGPHALRDEEVMQLRAEVNELRSRLDGLDSLPNTEFAYVDYAGGHWPGFTFGFDFVFVQPRFIESYDVQQTIPPSPAANLLPLDFDYSLAPRFHLGYKNSAGFGIRAQYWQYDDSTARTFASGPAIYSVQQLTNIFPATIAAVGGDTLNVTNSFRTQTVDIEATYDVTARQVEITGSLGVRFAELDQQRQAAVTGVFPQSLNFLREYRGFGLLAGADGRRPIGDWGLAAVFRARGSVVHGNKTLNRSVTGTFPSPPLPAPPTTPPLVSLEDAAETSLIGEIGIGLEFQRELGCFDVFTRVMYENRFWTAASTPALGLAGFEGFSVGVGAAR